MRTSRFSSAYPRLTQTTEASHCTIVEAEEIVEIGEIKPEEVHLPGLYVNRLFKGAKFEHKIEVPKFAEDEGSAESEDGKDPRSIIASRAAREFREGMNCNLGGSYSMRVTDPKRH